MIQEQSPDRHPLTQPVIRLCNDAAAVVEQHGGTYRDTQAAQLIRAEAVRLTADEATLVVVGEKKRGKSSLINALVGVANLMPVEVDIATNVHVLVRYASRLRALALVSGGDEPISIDPADINRYVAVDPATGAPHRDDVLSVEVGLPSPLLAEGIALVDTPGVGGLVSGHAQITLATVGMADALLFVLHGGTELTASELRFLGQASQRVATVFFVLTQIDKYPAWREILDRNRTLMAQHAPRYQSAPWFAVSSRAKTDADLALAAGNNEVAARRLEFSGFPALQVAIVEEVARRAAAVRLANAVHVVTMAVDPLVEMYERRLRSLTLDPGLAEDLAAREAAVRELVDRDAVWRKILASRIKDLEGVLQLGFRRSVNDLRAIVEEKISTAGPDDFAELAGDLEDGIRGVWMQLENATREGLTRISREIVGELHNAGAVEVANHMALPERLQRMPAPIAGPRDHLGFLAGVERLMPAYGAGSLAFTVLAVATGGLWIPFFVGIGVTAGLMGRRKRLQQLNQGRADAQRYLNRVTNELNTEVPPKIREGLAQAGTQLSDAINERLAEQRETVERELAEHRANVGKQQEDLATQRAEASAEIVTITAVARRAAELRGYLSGPA